MGLSHRRKKPKGVLYVRGFIQIGDQRRTWEEHPSGCFNESDVKAYEAKLENETREEFIHGIAVTRRKMIFDDAARNYIASGIGLSEQSRVVSLTFAFTQMQLGNIDAVEFERFARVVMPGRAKNTLERCRVTLASIYKVNGVPFPNIPSYGEDVILRTWLSHARADLLISCYPKHVRPIAMVACDCGLRARETVLLTVGDCVTDVGDGFFNVGTMANRTNKNGEARTVPWTPRVKSVLLPLIANRNPHERLFLNRYGEGYRDTEGEGGNPLDASHTRALKNAKWIKDDHKGPQPFRWHDWRHHFATWALVEEKNGGRGWQQGRLMKIGGWQDSDSLSKYVDVIDFDANGKILGKDHGSSIELLAA